MANLLDSKVQGSTGFSSNSEGCYRYEISLHSGQVNIWLEDQSSKKQWETGLLNKEDYVTTANVFVDASASDYVLCFQQCLDSPIGEDEDVKRTLVPQNGGNLKLKLSLKARFLQFTRNIDYTFELKSIAVERIDTPESRLKDQKEELERLRGKTDPGASVLLNVKSETCVGSKLQWKGVSGDSFAFNEDKTSIKVLVPGLYAFGLVMNGEAIESVATGSFYCCNGRYMYTSHRTIGSFMRIVQVEKDANFSVHCPGLVTIPYVPSDLLVVRIGG